MQEELEQVKYLYHSLLEWLVLSEIYVVFRSGLHSLSMQSVTAKEPGKVAVPQRRPYGVGGI